MSNKLTDFVAFPRQISKAFLDREMEPNEYLVLMALRGTANPYGIRRTSYEEVLHDILRGKGSVNYVNKILLSLKKKEYLWFEDRRGKRGGFDIRFSDCIRPDGFVSTIREHSDTTQYREPSIKPDGQRLGGLSQKSEAIRDDISSFLNDIPFT